jgi:hypothetical protein
MAQLCQKVENEHKFVQKADGQGPLTKSKAKEMTPVSAISLKVTRQMTKDDRRSRELTAVADGKTMRTGSCHRRPKGRGFWVGE